MKEKGGEKANGFRSEPKPSSLYSTTSRAPVCDRETHDLVACLVDKEFRGHSYRSHVSYIESHQGLLHMYGLKRVPSKSCLHHAAVVLAGCAKMQGVVGMLAGDAARGSLLGDSSGFSIMQYEDWEDAKRGIISRRRFVKLHVLADARGKKILRG